jgi:derlin-1
MYLPWVLLVWNVVLGGAWELPLLGIAVGHAVYYLDVLYPSNNNGEKLIPTPAIFSQWFPANTGVHGFSGATQPQPDLAQTTRTSWGRGNRLGSS